MAAAFKFNLYRDNAGQPGALIETDAVKAGESFFAEIVVWDSDRRDQGLAGIGLNIYWDPNILTEIDTPFSPAKVVTQNLPMMQTGSLDAAAGTITDLGGSAFVGAGRYIGGQGMAERFCLLHFKALVAGQSNIDLGIGASQIVTHPTRTLRRNQIWFDSKLVTVH
jgi:hypothetical protein